jgi:ATP-binding protein involved in chromosome partitioning
MEAMAREAVSALPGVTDVRVHMTAKVQGRGGLPERAALEGVGNIIAVASGKGGVGKSTVSVYLALALNRSGARVGLLDADIYGPNIPQMLGIDGPLQVHDKRILPVKAHGLSVISMGLMLPDDQPVIWRGPMLHGVIEQLLREVEWGEIDYLIVDLPPGTGDVQISLVQLVPLAGAVVVTTPQQVALADVRRAVMMFRRVEVPVLGLVENMSSFIVPTTGEEYFIFGKGGGERTAREYDVPFLGRIPIDPRICEGGDAGRPIVIDQPASPSAQAFGKIASQLAAQVSIHNLAAAQA